MKILIVYAHPESSSFNCALKNQAISLLKTHRHEVKISDLYAMRFNPVADFDDFVSINPQLPMQYNVIQRDAYEHHQLSHDIVEEQNKIAWCDSLILQFPLWWFSVPAILKGWLDRVITPGFGYDKNKSFESGLLKPRRAFLSTTTESLDTEYSDNGLHGKIEQYLQPVAHSLRFVGLNVFKPFIAYGVKNIDDTKRNEYLADFEKHVLAFTEQR